MIAWGQTLTPRPAPACLLPPNADIGPRERPLVSSPFLLSAIAASGRRQMPAAPGKDRPRALRCCSRSTRAVGPPGVQVQAPGIVARGQCHATRETRYAILTPSTACGSDDSDRRTGSPRPTAVDVITQRANLSEAKSAFASCGHPLHWLWAAMCPQPDSCSAAKLAHSITSSAIASSDGGTVRPSTLAVWRLMTSSNLLACMTGRSAGLVPLRMRPA